MKQWSELITEVDHNWREFKSGSDFQSGTNELHLESAIKKMELLLSYYKSNPQGDDRPHKYLELPKISLDIDEVLAGWIDAWVEKHSITRPVTCWNFDRWMYDRFVEMKDDKAFWLSLKPLIKPEDLPFEPTAYITARSIPQSWTEEWLYDVVGFPHVPVFSVGFGGSKVEIFKKAGVDIHVDDAFKNFTELNKAGCCCFLWDTPQNQRYNVGYKRIKDLKELVS